MTTECPHRHAASDVPSPWVVRFAPLVASGARVLDLAAGNAAYGKPSNPDFLLTPGELLEFARAKLTVVAFEQGLVGGDRPAVIQRLAAVGRERPWPPPLPEWG